MNIALGVEYHGAAYSGWQRQKHVPSVQTDLESAISQIADHPVRVVAAGRTDAGVHATQQIVSFASRVERPIKAWREGVNSLTSGGVKVRWAMPVADDFHARYSATSRRYLYLYRIGAEPAPLSDGLAWRVDRLDVDAMHRGGQALVGEHDFTTFRAAGCQAASAFRCIHRLNVRRFGEIAILDVQANAFLLHMVRNVAGALVEVGRGERDEAWIAERLVAKDRTTIGKTSPPQGLYLVDVGYPGQSFPPGTLPPPIQGLGSLDRL